MILSTVNHDNHHQPLLQWLSLSKMQPVGDLPSAVKNATRGDETWLLPLGPPSWVSGGSGGGCDVAPWLEDG